MSEFATRLASQLPEGITIPEPLEQAWTWLEEQGWFETTDGAMVLWGSPEDSEVAFCSNLDLEGWFAPGDPGFDRLMPIVSADGSGAVAVLWLDPQDQVRFGLLGSEGGGELLAADAVDFLRLFAIGYDDLGLVGLDPEEESLAEAHAPLRQWVEQTFEVSVPEVWPEAAQPDPFATWVAEQKGWDQPSGQ